jgi:hypothetical protein
MCVVLRVLCLAVDARHGMPRKGVNLVRSGERYAYALYLLAYHLKDCAQLHIDIMCKWGPWLLKTLDSLSEGPPVEAPPEIAARIVELQQLAADAGNYQALRKVLSHAHGNLHALNCQVSLLSLTGTACRQCNRLIAACISARMLDASSLVCIAGEAQVEGRNETSSLVCATLP